MRSASRLLYADAARRKLAEALGRLDVNDVRQKQDDDEGAERREAGDALTRSGCGRDEYGGRDRAAKIDAVIVPKEE